MSIIKHLLEKKTFTDLHLYIIVLIKISRIEILKEHKEKMDIFGKISRRKVQKLNENFKNI